MQDIQRQVALLLATGATPEKIQEKTGITPDTLNHWRSNGPFNQVLAEYRVYFHEENSAYLRLLFGMALKEVKKLLQSDSEQIRLEACRLVIDAVKQMEKPNTRARSV